VSKQRRWLRQLLAVALLVIVSLAGFSAYQWWLPQKIRVAVDAPVITQLVFDPSEIDTAVMYLEENPGSRIELIALYYDLDPQNSPVGFQTEMAAGTDFFITTQASSTIANSLRLFETPDALLVNTSSTTPLITGKDDAILRIIPDAEQEQAAIADYISQLPGNRVLVLQDQRNEGYTDPAIKFFSERLNAIGGWDITVKKFLIGQFNPADFETLMAEPFDVMYVLAGNLQPSIGNLVQLFHQYHPSAPILLTPWARSASVYHRSGQAIDRVVLMSHFPAKSASAAISDYIDRFEKRFGYQPMAMALKVRQSLEMLDQAFAHGHTTPAAVKRYLLDQDMIQTSLGDFSFDQNGDVRRAFFPIKDLRQELR